ncbi:MAG: type II toxin-antitoxin system RelE/ParE family toxin [Janthinobacterium lividum]
MSARAAADLHGIFRFINGAESEAAAKWFNDLEELVTSLATLPYRGVTAAHDPQLRYLLFGNKPHIYRILYRVDDATNLVAIRTIRHGARKS